MKKFLITMMCFIFILGMWLGIKSSKKTTQKEVETIEEEVANENYINELNLPLIEVDSLNPILTNNSQVYSILQLIYEPLFEYAPDESLRGVLAQNCSKLDNHTYIITLHPNIKWHRGGAFTAVDVAFTIEALKNHESVFSSHVANIQKVETLDEQSLKVHLNEPDDFFEEKLTFPIIPEYYFKDEGLLDEKKAARPCGTGVYQYDSTLENGKMILRFNEDYNRSGNLVKLQTITLNPYASYGEAIKAFKSAQIDMIPTNMYDWKVKFGTIGLNCYSFENTEWEVIIPNLEDERLGDSAVRNAILRSINRENLINTVYLDNAVISDIGIHTNSKNSITNMEYDKEKAKQLLIGAGWIQDDHGWYKELDGKKIVLSFQLLVDKNNEQKMKVAEKIKEDLKEIGIMIEIRAMNLSEIKKEIEKDHFELALVSLNIEGEYHIEESIKEQNYYHFSNLSSNKLNRLLEEMVTDKETKEEKMADFLSVYKSELPYLGLYYKTSTILTNKSVKGNINPNWFKIYRNMETFCK